MKPYEQTRRNNENNARYTQANWSNARKQVEAHHDHVKQKQQLQSKEFDYTFPDLQLEIVAVEYAAGWFFSSYPDEEAIAQVVQYYRNAGWDYVGRKEEVNWSVQQTVLKFA